MKYYHLKALLSARKTSIEVSHPSSSFATAGPNEKPYIEPTFEKVEFEKERPTVILVSAVGATGKTALARQLSRDLQLPLLDLAEHRPVGDNTLTGLLTSAFDVAEIGEVFSRLNSGNYGIIIDGVDEGRAKTTGKAFEAFLDDIAKLGSPESDTTFVLLGRTQTLEDCWLYLTDKDVSTGLITISPFTIEEARDYIDAFTVGPGATYPPLYAKARDTLLEKLGSAFSGGPTSTGDDFLAFIGYPPVLDAIATLLNEEKNYFKLLNELVGATDENVEVSLLHRIAQYILQRERALKVIPNIVEPLVDEAPEELKQRAWERAFSIREQCARLVGYCIGRQLSMSIIGEPVLDENYEEQLRTFLPEHPFISGRGFRNAVFEALALATLMASDNVDDRSLLNEYVASHKHSYHVVYMLNIVSQDRRIGLDVVAPLLTSAMEFRSVHSSVEIRVDGPGWEDQPVQGSIEEIEIDVEITLGDSGESQTFSFLSQAAPESTLYLGPSIAGAFISVPGTVVLSGARELEFGAPVEITARTVKLDGSGLILKKTDRRDSIAEIIVDAERLETSLETITTNGIPIIFRLRDRSGVSYPAIQYTKLAAESPKDENMHQKYLRLKRILVEFRSHSQGALARYKYKIENPRVLRNEIGASVLKKLVADQILVLDVNRYFLDPQRLSALVGVSWTDLRKGEIPESLEGYLRSIT